jgi:CelD/BcsL family acetyltransferase involved in cellulose biosynthesis
MTTAIHSADGTTPDVARISLSDALTCGPECWDALAASAATQSPFMRWAWHRAWSESASQPESQTSIAVMLYRPDASVQAVLPLAVRSVPFRRSQARALTWAIGDAGAPDHLDIPAARDADLDAAIPQLESLPWDVAVFSGVADDAQNLTRLIDGFERRGYAVRRTPMDSCPYIELPDSWDGYLATLSKSRRQSIRWQERRLMREHAVTITDYTSERFDEGWRHLCALHDERWAGVGALGEERISKLVRRFAEDLAARGELWLTTLDVSGEPVAAWMGFACGDTVSFYQSGRDPKWASQSVGLILLGAMIRRAIELGYRRFDFLRGQEAYKLSWTSTTRPVYEILVFRPGWRGTWLRGLDLAGRTRARLRSRGEHASGSA